MTGPYTTIPVDEWLAMKERAEAVERRILEARRLAYEDAAMIAESAHMQPGAVIHVAEVRRTEPYITGNEWASHVARMIRARAKEVEG
jgi:hypothetical protein